MAKLSLTRHPKFLRLVAHLRVPEQHVRGHLDYLWESCWEAVSPVVGTVEIVELISGWSAAYPDRVGDFAHALEDIGFLERDEANRLCVHDFLDHAPDYVVKRARRAEARRASYIIEDGGQRPPSGGQRPTNTERNGTPRNAPERHGTERGTAPADTQPAITPDALALVWNEECRKAIQPCRSVTPERRDKARALLDANPSLDYWRSIMRRINASPFCRGETGKDFRATFDWLLDPSTHVKVAEGNYDPSPQHATPRSNKTAGNAEAFRRFVGAKEVLS